MSCSLVNSSSDLAWPEFNALEGLGSRVASSVDTPLLARIIWPEFRVLSADPFGCVSSRVKL